MQNDPEPQSHIKLLISGGHLSPAIAVIEVLRKSSCWDITFMARKYGHEETRTPASEIREIPKLGVPIITIPAGKIPRSLSFSSLLPILRIPLGFVIAFWHIWRLQPDIILSFGGYVAVPAAVSGWLLGIPIVTHEQTIKKGLANTLVELLANEIAISWEDTRKYFRKKVVLTGNPLREAIIKGKTKSLPIQLNKQPLVYVTGGNLGSKKINLVIKSELIHLVRKYCIIHQCGYRTGNGDFHTLLKARGEMPQELKNRYLIREWLDTEEVSWALNHADLVISRAGANIITELAYTGRVAILIPFQYAGGNEQLENAKFLTNIGTTEIIHEKNLTGKLLRKKIALMLKNINRYKVHASQARKLIKIDAAQRIETLLKTIYEKKKY